METFTTLTDHPDIKVGDIITMPVLERRKWWQLWKPKYGPPKKGTYRVTAVHVSTINLDD